LKFTVKDRDLRRSLMGAREVIDEQDARIAALFEQIRAEGDVQRTAAAAPIQANYAADLSLEHIAEAVGRSDRRAVDAVPRAV
jgi:hypothetical protein